MNSTNFEKLYMYSGINFSWKVVSENVSFFKVNIIQFHFLCIGQHYPWKVLHYPWRVLLYIKSVTQYPWIM